jgi:hypothetical protein
MKMPCIITIAASLFVAFTIPVVLRADEAQSVKPMPSTTGQERAFLAENEAAMNKMMDGMAAKPTGDVDRDFVAMMTPHHQGAVDMAIIELRYGKNENLRRIAQEIIVDQMQEIAAMKLAIGEPATDTAPAPTQQQPASPAAEHHPGTQMNMPGGMKR